MEPNVDQHQRPTEKRTWVTPDIVLVSSDDINGGTFNINENSSPLPGIHGYTS